MSSPNCTTTRPGTHNNEQDPPRYDLFAVAVYTPAAHGVAAEYSLLALPVDGGPARCLAQLPPGSFERRAALERLLRRNGR